MPARPVFSGREAQSPTQSTSLLRLPPAPRTSPRRLPPAPCAQETGPVQPGLHLFCLDAGPCWVQPSPTPPDADIVRLLRRGGDDVVACGALIVGRANSSHFVSQPMFGIGPRSAPAIRPVEIWRIGYTHHPHHHNATQPRPPSFGLSMIIILPRRLVVLDRHSVCDPAVSLRRTPINSPPLFFYARRAHRVGAGARLQLVRRL